MVNDIIAYVTLFAQKGAQLSVNSRNQINNVDSLSIKMLNFDKLHSILKDLFIKEKCFFCITVYIFQMKIRKQFYHTALGNCCGLKLAKCRLKFKK